MDRLVLFGLAVLFAALAAWFAVVGVRDWRTARADGDRGLQLLTFVGQFKAALVAAAVAVGALVGAALG